MQIVSVSSLKGGVGKSSVTLGLASAALQEGVPTLVVDLDPHADATTGLGVRARHGHDVGEVLARPRRGALDKVLMASSWAVQEGRDSKALDVAPGSARSSRFDRSDYRDKDLGRLERALAGTTGYELVLVDCPPTLSALTRTAWAASDKVLSVAEPSLFSVAGTKRTMTAIAQFEQSRTWAVPAAGVVVNKVRHSSAEHRHRLDELAELFGPLLVDPVLPDLPVWQQAQGAAWPIHRWPGGEARDLAGRYTALLRGLLGRSA
ncbi:ParA family protein [Kocuria sp. LUK]|uniref:Chromosome partitioning protein ParA n=1 Tax=Kocuria flava TaxID=446860 RepID=A0A2N4T460_9MICC|nr:MULTISPECIES: ParA family protein [Kocuria]MCD1144149.1 ParA family protein [Kocuria sp. LUK]PLC13028.1 chromosome partitioning protein ParA [Kocuria flava]